MFASGFGYFYCLVFVGCFVVGLVTRGFGLYNSVASLLGMI